MDQTLTAFRDLFRHTPGIEPGEQQRRASLQLPDVVKQSALCWWSPDRPTPEDAEFLLIGAAVWSGYDLNLLDHVDAAIRSRESDAPRVYIFNADTMQSQEQIEQLMPGVGYVHHTPFVGYWRAGALVESACGYEGRKLVARVLNIDDKPLHIPARAS